VHAGDIALALGALFNKANYFVRAKHKCVHICAINGPQCALCACRAKNTTVMWRVQITRARERERDVCQSKGDRMTDDWLTNETDLIIEMRAQLFVYGVCQ
jgi:hypothetical protein